MRPLTVASAANTVAYQLSWFRTSAGQRQSGLAARVAISIAVIAAVRATAGRMPMPTVSRSVRASAVADRLMPAV